MIIQKILVFSRFRIFMDSLYVLLWVQENACVCQPTEKFFISYMNSSTQASLVSPDSNVPILIILTTANLLNS